MRKYIKLLLLIIVATLSFNVKALDIIPPEEIPTTTQNERIYENKETDYKVVIMDEANLLSSTEIDKLMEKMKPLTEYGHIGFITTNENTFSTTEKFADNIYHNLFGKQSGTIFVIDMDKRKVFIFSDGANYNKITTSKADSITDNIYEYASDKEYYECAYNAFDQIEKVLKGERIAEPMKYASNIFIALASGFIINFLFALSVSKNHKASVTDVVKKADVKFNVSNIVGIKTGTHMVYNPPSSSSSGSSGGGGGGSSGGGGGHSF